MLVIAALAPPAWSRRDAHVPPRVRSLWRLVCVHIPHNSPTAGGAAWAEAAENSAVASALRVPAQPLSERDGLERPLPIWAAATDHVANAKFSFLNGVGIEPPQHRYQKPL
jgi:hypothetical protein